jgi:hypothetical protein
MKIFDISVKIAFAINFWFYHWFISEIQQNFRMNAEIFEIINNKFGAKYCIVCLIRYYLLVNVGPTPS